MNKPRANKRLLVSAVAGLSLLLTACGGGAQNNSDQAKGEDAFEIKNCGETLHFDKPAERAVTVEQGATDTVLSLGQGDKIAGYGHQKGKTEPKYQDQFKKLKEISPKIPTTEQIRMVDPDVIISPFKSVYTDDSSGTRAEWHRLGVQTFISNIECRDEPENQGLDGYQLLEKDYEQLGEIFGAHVDAKAMRDKQLAAIKEAGKVKKDVPKGTKAAVLYSIYEGAPYIAGNESIAQNMFDIVGLKNAFGKVQDPWPEISWEAFADANPDVIVLADLPERGSPGDKASEKIDMLKKDPATRDLDAVVNNRFIIVEGVGLSGSARSLKPLDQIVQGIKDGVITKGDA